MTQTPPEAAEALEAVTVVQADRDAAIEHYVRKGFPTREQAAKMINSWSADAHILQMLARHRIAHTRAQPSREEVAELFWRTDLRRAAGKERIVPWSEAGDAAHSQFGSYADAILALIGSSAGEREIIERCARVADACVANCSSGAGKLADEKAIYIAAAIRALAQPAIQGERER